MKAIDVKDVMTMVPYARQCADAMPERIAMSADDVSIAGLAYAHVNAERRKDGWCKCEPEGEQVYFREAYSGVHGWICSRCRGVTQMG